MSRAELAWIPQGGAGRGGLRGAQVMVSALSQTAWVYQL